MQKPDSDTTCRYTGHEKKCRDLFMNCPAWINVQGTNPQTGEIINKFGCSDSFLHLLLIENSQMQKQTGASIESFRNAVIQANNTKAIEHNGD